MSDSDYPAIYGNNSVHEYFPASFIKKHFPNCFIHSIRCDNSGESVPYPVRANLDSANINQTTYYTNVFI